MSMIFTDYWMPEMTGYELLKKVKVMMISRHDQFCTKTCKVLIFFFLTSLHAGIIQAEADPGGDHVVRERADQDQQMPGGRRRGFPGEARPRVGRVARLQPRAPLSTAARGGGVFFAGAGAGQEEEEPRPERTNREAALVSWGVCV